MEQKAEVDEFYTMFHQRTPWGGGKKRGVENLMNDTPPKKGFWTPPLYGTFSTPLRCQCSVFPVQKSTTEQARSSFGRGPKIFGRARSLVRFPPPIRFAPPHITAQFQEGKRSLNIKCLGGISTFGPDMFGWRGGLPREGVGAEKFGMSLESVKPVGLHLYSGDYTYASNLFRK